MTQELIKQADNIVQRLKQESAGRPVWRVMEPDGKAYVLEIDRDSSPYPGFECEGWLREQQANGRYVDHFVSEATVLSSSDRTMRDAIGVISSMQRRIDELESHLATTIEMKTR